MLKNVADASGPGVFVIYIVNLVAPFIQPTLIFLGLIASLVWYGIRFHDRIKYGPNFDD